MNKKQQGIALLVVGAGLIIWGLNMAGTFGGKVSSAFTGSPGDTPMMLYIVGAICVAAGIYRIK
ncbi:MAG: DUF3185 family protein [Acidiferrobacterales bacterium]|jgi:hypothetical protein|nr:DUF3185 family protein [Acidiferrobacterales bacterium]